MQKKPFKILIVDDNRIIREVLRGLLRGDESLKVVGVAANGDSALEMVTALKPDLVCLDVLMPGLDGVEVLRRIRAQHPQVRVVLVTGESRADVVTHALRAGASGFVVKPFNSEKMLRTIHAALAAPIPECQPDPEPQTPPSDGAASEAGSEPAEANAEAPAAEQPEANAEAPAAEQPEAA